MLIAKNQRTSVLIIILLIAASCSAMAYSKNKAKPGGGDPETTPDTGVVSVLGQLTQDKIYTGGDGRVSMGLTITARDDIPHLKALEQSRANVDLVIVLDRSGSMNGDKITNAKAAIHRIVNSLSPGDRLGLVSYSNTVQVHAPLANMTPENQQKLASLTNAITAGGGTNLGAGLYEGIQVIAGSRGKNNAKVILISDGMANQGITDPAKLAPLTDKAVTAEASVSTVGVGIDFNEYLMTKIADHGGGAYHFLENPAAFAAVFEKELYGAAMAVADGIEIRVPLSNGLTLIEAAGYPIETRGDYAVFRPGALMPGQTRNLFLTLRAPVGAHQEFLIKDITVSYRHNGEQHVAALGAPLRFACVEDPNKALASINKGVWEEKVLQDDMNKLREQVAEDIRGGKKDAALQRIEEYQEENEALNQTVGSEAVANASAGLDDLKAQVHDTFQGEPAAVEMKQKKAAKSMQHLGYEGRRSMK